MAAKRLPKACIAMLPIPMHCNVAYTNALQCCLYQCIAMYTHCRNLTLSLHRRVNGNITKEPFCNLYATLPGKCFASLMRGCIGEFTATLQCKLFASVLQPYYKVPQTEEYYFAGVYIGRGNIQS